MSRFTAQAAYDYLTTWESMPNVGLLLAKWTLTPSTGHVFVSEVSGHELSGGGYARLTTIPGRTRTLDVPNSRIVYDAGDVVFPSLQAAAGTPKYGIFYDSTEAADADRKIIGWITLKGQSSPSPDTPDGSSYRILWDPVGLWVLST